MTHSTLPTADRVRVILDHRLREPQAGKQPHDLAHGGVAGEWGGCELSSVFQAIVDPSRHLGVGQEAFVRCLGGGAPPARTETVPPSVQRYSGAVVEHGGLAG